MERTCRICGATLTEGVAYCTNCGASNGGGQMIPETQINLKASDRLDQSYRIEDVLGPAKNTLEN